MPIRRRTGPPELIAPSTQTRGLIREFHAVSQLNSAINYCLPPRSISARPSDRLQSLLYYLMACGKLEKQHLCRFVVHNESPRRREANSVLRCVGGHDFIALWECTSVRLQTLWNCAMTASLCCYFVWTQNICEEKDCSNSYYTATVGEV